jgi:phosphohistidine swiveling domain-containing protein
VDSQPHFVIPLAEVTQSDESLVGAKAARLGALAKVGHNVAPGFCVTVRAYDLFLAESRLAGLIRMELDRKRFEDMRWEEIWDAALRIRSGFLAHPVPPEVSAAVGKALASYPSNIAWAVRSSAPGEDSTHRSFAGLHESYVGVVGCGPVMDALRLVWASLWSDAAMLYRREVGLDPARSQMAVLVQAMRTEAVSGVAFGCDPRQLSSEIAIVEAVPGLCGGLVDGQVDPDRWMLRRSDGKILEWQRGHREQAVTPSPLLAEQDLSHLLRVVKAVESLFGWPPDIEWTGCRERFTLLQARPITTVAPAGDDKRGWYLTLRPGMARLRRLRTRVAEELIPALEAEGNRLAGEDLEARTTEQLAEAIEERLALVRQWTKTYWEEFIPFAHGVRRLALYYNDAVRPRDPYEFVGLLHGEDLLATQRNAALRALADRLKRNPSLCDAIARVCASTATDPANWEQEARTAVGLVKEGEPFLADFRRTLETVLDLAYANTRLADRPDLILRAVLELAHAVDQAVPQSAESGMDHAAALQQRLFTAVGHERHEEALEMLEIARLSWRLRDNDNLLLARVESQLLRALHVATRQLNAAGRLANAAPVTAAAAEPIIAALRDRSAGVVTLAEPTAPERIAPAARPAETLRQVTGQPAAPGLATGKVRRIRSSEDLGRFAAGEVLVCDAIQPMMTHLVPLACAVVERRGGMLIHGAIIARELRIPCVNGIAGVVDLLQDGDLVTVDGYLGIVTVGPPEFDLELADRK